ncbi:hypothetical protein [Fructilactobacillus sanfranciscensis]|uniref:hypothetical protein n=1 Tax=Fructilactobacillus sanfranciscensis TaxID=1625 RepID=UPI003B978816
MKTATKTRLGGLDRRFHINELNTNARTETVAGTTTFVSMAYTLFVNTSNLGASV